MENPETFLPKKRTYKKKNKVETFDEIKLIENEIKGIVPEPIDSIEPPKNDTPKLIPQKRPTKKQSLVDKILEVYDLMKVPSASRKTPAQLKSTKLETLEIILANLTTDVTKELVNNVDDMSDDLAAEGLFRVNVIVFKSLETVVQLGHENETTGKYIPSIKGATDRLMGRKALLKECLKSIIEKYGEKIKPLMDPIYVWAAVMLGIIQEQLTENALKAVEKEKKNI